MKPIKHLFLPLVTAALATFTQSASAVLLDFEAFTQPGVGVDLYSSPFQTQGFQFTGNLVGSDYLIQQTASPHFAGSTALSPFSGETHTFQRIDGAAFDLLSFDYSESFSDLGIGSIDFMGNFAGGGSITQTVTSDGIFGFQSVNFVGFTDLSNVVFSYPGSNDLRFQLDNISLSSESSVPESGSTLAMLGLVAAGLVGVRRRRS